MQQSSQVEHSLLVAFVSLLGLEAGAGVYETSVLVPRWSGSPPESLRAWDSTLTEDSRDRFWKLIHPALTATALGVLVSGWKTPWSHRRWVVASTTGSLAVEAASLGYFVPTLVNLLVNDGSSLSAAEQRQQVRRWVSLNRGRAAVGSAALLCALQALRTLPTRA